MLKRLKKLNYPQKKYPTLRELIEPSKTNRDDEKLLEKDEKEKKRSRSVFFCVGVSSAWNAMPISQVIKRLKEKYKFKWLRFSMSFHKFANFGELLNSDLNQKLMAGIEDLTHITRECNCNGRSKLDDNKCHYDEKCRHGCVVYSL